MNIEVLVSLDNLEATVKDVLKQYRQHTVEIDSNEDNATIKLVIKTYSEETIKVLDLVKFNGEDLSLWNVIWDEYQLLFCSL